MMIEYVGAQIVSVTEDDLRQHHRRLDSHPTLGVTSGPQDTTRHNPVR